MDNITVFLAIYRFVFIAYIMTFLVYNISHNLNPVKDFKSIKLDAIVAIVIFIYSFFHV